MSEGQYLPHLGESHAHDLILGPRSVLVCKIVSFFSRGPQWVRPRARGCAGSTI